jgi:hypothetical protein
LDWIITIIKNWPHDPHLNFTPNVDLKDYLKVEIGLVEGKHELIEEAAYFEVVQVDED